MSLLLLVHSKAKHQRFDTARHSGAKWSLIYIDRDRHSRAKCRSFDIGTARRFCRFLYRED